MGYQCVSYVVTRIWDDNNYMASLGQTQTARVIAEATLRKAQEESQVQIKLSKLAAENTQLEPKAAAMEAAEEAAQAEVEAWMEETEAEAAANANTALNPHERPKTAPLQQVSLGIIRLDYDYPPTPGDIDDKRTFDYDVYYRVVPGFTVRGNACLLPSI